MQETWPPILGYHDDHDGVLDDWRQVADGALTWGMVYEERPLILHCSYYLYCRDWLDVAPSDDASPAVSLQNQ